MNKTRNVKLSLVVIAIIVNHSLLRFIINDRSSCDLMYLEIFMRLGLWDRYLKLYADDNLLVFNYSSASLRGAIELLVSFGEGKDEKKS